MIRSLLLAWLLVAGQARAAAPPGVPPGVILDLELYYADETLEGWPHAERLLRSAFEPEDRRRVVAYLLAVARQHAADQSAQEGEGTPVSGAVRAVIAAAVATMMGKESLTTELMPLIDWFLDHEPNHDILDHLASVVAEERVLAVRVLRGPHRNFGLVVGAVEGMASRKEALPTGARGALASHYRAEVREALRRHAAAVGGPPPPSFDPVRCLRSPQVQAVLRKVGELLPETPPLDAHLVRVRQTEERGEEDTFGWLLSRNRSQVVILAGLERKTIALRPGDTVTRIRPTDAHVEPLALAWWLDRRGEAALAARLLLPHLDKHGVSRSLSQFADDVREECGWRMLDAFVRQRDYRAAMHWARRVLTGPCRAFRPEARRLLAELPRRLDDFRGFKLPTLIEWRELRASMTRAELIDYLCRRLRLGGDTPPEKAGPADPIDPASELRRERLVLADVPRLARHMRDDWALLAVRESWWQAIPSLGIASRVPPVLVSHRHVLAELVNEAARGTICHLGSPERPLGEQETARLVAVAVQWARTHSGKTPAELEWLWLRHEMRPRRFQVMLADVLLVGGDWESVAVRIDRLHALGDRNALRLLHALLLDARRVGHTKREAVLAQYARLDPRRGREFAAAFLRSPHDGLRNLAARLCLGTAQADKARRILAESLRDADRSGHVADAVVALFDDGTPESKRIAARAATDRIMRLLRREHQHDALRRLGEAGFREVYAFYLLLLRSEHQPGIAWEICMHLGRDDARVKAIAERHRRLEDRIPGLEAWLREMCRPKPP